MHDILQIPGTAAAVTLHNRRWIKRCVCGNCRLPDLWPFEAIEPV
jgi:hypothetical protein